MAHGTTKSMELLAPAGVWEQLEYALLFGADAVYVGCDRYSMRAKAQNFTLDEMPHVCEYVHSHGAKVHVTCNIVMNQDDIDTLPGYLEALDAAGADALIVEDLGAIRLVRTYAPHVEIHVSTQASVCNAQAALVYYELGARRIVCAREMSVAQIAAMRAQIPDDLELEVFAHGSMCMAYSGRCLISDYLTGRSANRGLCTQSCRWSYALEEAKRPGEYIPVEETPEGTYILSSKDINMLAHLDDLAAAGINSIKLEGRNRKAFYVASVVNAYRQVLDGAPAQEFAGELECISHHPYSTGFFYGPASQDPYTPESVQGGTWVGQVVSCEASDDADGARTGGFVATIRCRNRFEVGEELSVLSPHRPVRSLVARDLMWLPAPTDDDPSPEPIAVGVANRGMELYQLHSDFELHPMDIIRANRMQ